jgi:Yip1 domain
VIVTAAVWEQAGGRVMDLQNRVKGILTNPRAEWLAIAAEPDDVVAIYRNYIVLLAAIPAISIFLGLTIFGVPLFGRYGMSTALGSAGALYISSLVAPLIAAVVLEKLAPRFQSSGSTAQALKLVAYASTPVWVAGVCYVMLMLAPLVMIATLYAIYLLYLGMPVLMKTPYDKVVPFMVVAALVIVVLNVVLRSIVAVFGFPAYGV